MVWELHCTTYGLSEAVVDFDTHYAEVSVASLARSGSCRSQACSSDSVRSSSRSTWMTAWELSEHILLKMSPTLWPGGKQLHLGRLITRSADGEGYTIRCAEKTVGKLKYTGNARCLSRVPPSLREQHKTTNAKMPGHAESCLAPTTKIQKE